MKKLIIPMMLIVIQLSVNAQSFIDNNTINAVPQIDLGEGYVLDFSDEFNDNSLDLSKWNLHNFDKSRAGRPTIGVDGWYWKKENVWLADGNLVLHASKPKAGVMFCGSVNASNKYERQYGYYETRIKIGDASKGSHTAFWFMGDGMSNVDGTANDGAEIDILESAWLGEYTKATVHIDGYGADHQNLTKRVWTPGIHDGNYHTYALWWTKDFLKVYYDGELKVTYDEPKWLVHAPEYMWLSNGASFGLEGDQYFKDLPLGTLSHSYVDYARAWVQGNVVPDGPMKTILEIEAENAIITGEPLSDTCSFASNEEVINLKKTGVISFQDIDMDTIGPYFLRVSYISGDDRQADILVNGVAIPTTNFVSSGGWCSESERTATIDIPVDLNLENNSIEIRSTGKNGPHIDKISVVVETSLLSTHEQIRNESIAVFYADNELRINNYSQTLIKKIEAYSLTGALIDNFSTTDSDYIQIPIPNYSPGIYLVRILTEHGNFVKKVFIN
jgi:hypothetical protein